MRILRNIGDPLKDHLLFLNKLASQLLCEGIGQWFSKIEDFILSPVKFTVLYSWEKMTDQMHGEYPLIDKMPDYEDDSSKPIWKMSGFLTLVVDNLLNVLRGLNTLSLVGLEERCAPA